MRFGTRANQHVWMRHLLSVQNVLSCFGGWERRIKPGLKTKGPDYYVGRKNSE